MNIQQKKIENDKRNITMIHSIFFYACYYEFLSLSQNISLIIIKLYFYLLLQLIFHVLSFVFFHPFLTIFFPPFSLFFLFFYLFFSSSYFRYFSFTQFFSFFFSFFTPTFCFMTTLTIMLTKEQRKIRKE